MSNVKRKAGSLTWRALMMKAFLLLLVLKLNAAYGIGYKFDDCQPWLAEAEEYFLREAEDPARFVPEGRGRREWASRQARLTYIRASEENRALAACTAMQIIQDKVKEFKEDHEPLVEDRFKLLSILKESLEFLDDGDEAETTRDLIHLLEIPATPQRDLLRGIDRMAIPYALGFSERHQALADGLAEYMDQEVERIQLASKKGVVASQTGFDPLQSARNRIPSPTIEQILPFPLQDSPKGRLKAKRILQLVPSINALSQLRELLFLRLAAEADPNQSLVSVGKKKANQLFREELNQLEYDAKNETTEGAEEKPDGWLYRSCIRNAENRDRFLTKAKRLSNSSRLTPFLREDLIRQIRFVEDFDLPIDPSFRKYVSLLAQIDEMGD